MAGYGQYCPVAHALDILGDRWTLLIIRDLMLGVHHFNDLERGLPGISRGLLSKRLQQLQANEIIEKRVIPSGRQSTEYHLTQAGYDLEEIVFSLLTWGTKWAFDEPKPEELDPVLLMWWLHRNVNTAQLPEERVVAQFDFYGAEAMSFWLLLSRQDVTLCITDPGFEINLLVTADLATFYKLWGGRVSYHDAIESRRVRVEGMPRFTRAFPQWFAWQDYDEFIRTRSYSHEPTAEDLQG
jgi:DNA-binding HxlR family transcriptional regulator